MAYNKIGFHCGVNGNAQGIGDYMARLDAAGIPFVIKSVEDYGVINQSMQYQNAAHVRVFRLSNRKDGGPQFDTPNYDVMPEAAARAHWQMTLNYLPPEFDKSVWLEVINEPDKNRADWLGWFGVEIARLAAVDGYKVALFGFSGGEPEPEHWETAGMLAYLSECARRPDEVAVALHEYSLVVEDIWALDADAAGPLPGWLVGRFQHLHAMCDKYSLSYPTILITEWGWEYDNVPGVETAVSHIADIAELYAAYPNILGAGLWYLGGDFGDIHNQAQKLILPVTEYTLAARFPDPPPIDPPNGGNPVKHKAIVVKLPQDMTAAEWNEAAAVAFGFRHTMTASHDDMLTILDGGNEQSFVKFSHPERDADAVALVEAAGYAWQRLYNEPPPPAKINLKYRPCQTTTITQHFGENPGDYPLTPGHEGIDYAVVKDAPFYAAQDGIVVHASDRRWSTATASSYGWHVVLDHGDFCTVYAHARQDLPVVVGQSVAAGKVVGYSGNTGNSKGYHLHFSLLDKTGTIDPSNGYPTWTYGRPVNPLPFVSGKPAPATPPPAATVDILQYMIGTDKQQHTLQYTWGGGGTETVQTRITGNEWMIVKGGNGNYEQLYYDANWIYRAEDTSESAERFYTQSTNGTLGAAWVKRRMAVGETVYTSKDVQHYLKAGCVPQNGGLVTDKLTLTAVYPSYTFDSGITLPDVIRLEWAAGEGYLFAKGYGLVGFEFSGGKSYISELALSGRDDLPIVVPSCLDLTGRYYV